jgi:diguanylate cyclase (GGDEF)-like protein/PAS domain S-box-containing protein
MQATKNALLVGLACALMAVGIGLVLGRHLTRPLKHIASAARDVELGVPGAVIPHADDSEEITHLSSALQSMTTRLEHLVQERTAQLNEAIHELHVLGEEQHAMLDNDLVGIVRLNMSTRVAIWNNRALSAIFGYSMDELRGQSARMLYPDEATYEKVGAEARAAFAEGHDYVTRVQMRHHDGSTIWIHLQGTPLKERPGESLWLMTDVTAQHRYQEQVEHIAFHDALTGLPNRLLLADRVGQAIAATQRSGQMSAIAFMDLDGFKAVNDLHGHEAGDHLLKEIAKRASATVRAGDTVARLGGDEFVLVLGPLRDQAQCDLILQRLLTNIGKPVQLPGGISATVSGSIGVALCPQDGDTPTVLLAEADAAMYEAKRQGKGCVRYNAG